MDVVDSDNDYIWWQGNIVTYWFFVMTENSALYEALNDSLRNDDRKTDDGANGNVAVSDTTPLPAPITAGGIQDDK